MAKPYRLSVDFAKLAGLDGGRTAATLAMVCNDIASANSAVNRLAFQQPPGLTYMERGIRVYFHRMQCAHLLEGLAAIKEVKQSQSLMSTVAQCSQRSRSAFTSLCNCLQGGSEHKMFKESVGWIRNRIAFHYSAGDIDWAIKDRAQRTNAQKSSMTAGQDIHSTRFEFGDDLIDSIVCRRLWGIPRQANARQEANRIALWCDQKARDFIAFCGGFVPCFFNAHGVTQYG